jgi:hypothetical protein
VWIDEWYNGYSFDILNQGDAWSFHLEYYGIFFMTQYMQMAVCNYSFNLQEWYHVAITYDRSLEEILFYVNGSLECSGYFASDIVDDFDDPMYIGHTGLYSNDYAKGRIDELNIFNRAISAEEVMELFQGGLSGDVSWLSVDPTSGSIPTNAAASVSVTFDSTGLELGTYTTNLYINSNDPQQPALTIPVSLTVVAEQAGVSITPLEATQTGSPGETVAYTFTLTNLGTVPDIFSLEVSSTWTTTLSTDTTGEIEPGETFTILAHVTIPLEAQHGDQDLAMITGTSTNDPEVSASAEATTTAVWMPGVDITPAETAQQGSPGETVAYTFTLTNLGNVTDSFTLEVSSTWQAELPVTTTGELGPGETFTFVVYVTVPLEAQDGAQDLAVITATSAHDPQVSAEAQATTTCMVSIYHTALPLVYKK